MNEYPIEPGGSQPPEPAAPMLEQSLQPAPPERPPRHPQRRRRSWTDHLPLFISLLALFLAGASLYVVLQGGQEPEPPPEPPEEPATFQFGGQTMVPMEGMPLNPYSREDFSLDRKGRVTHPQGKTGVDVSAYQKEIDWSAVAGDGIEFAILRLGYRGYTEGGLFMDQTFSQNIQGALDAGLEVGVYFFSQAITPEEAVAEAAYVINALEGYRVTYPVAFDWEPIAQSGARTAGLDGGVLTQCASAFCEKIREAGYTPAVYFNQTLGYLRYDLRELTDQVLWLAEYDTQPDFYYRFDLWQYTHTGQVEGIEGNVDLDLDLRQ